MPGIYGIISKRPEAINIEELKAMGGSMHTEPFYRKGDYTFSEGGVCVGWTCHEGSFSDCMPVINEKKDILLFYSGENFKEIEEIDELKGRNHSFNKRNASYLVHMYEEWGEDFLAMLNGHSHGILIDKRNGKTILFNDRYGLHRLYYCEGKDTLYFSTEAKAILAILPAESRRIDMPGLAEFFTYNCVLDNRSLFKNVFLLPGGSSWVFNGDGTVDRKTYFHPSTLETQPLLEREFHYERLVYTLQKLLKRYFKAEDKIGIRLSNDLDIRIILANALYGPEKVPCYAPGGPYGSSDESQSAQQIVGVTGQVLHIIALDSEFMKQYPRLSQKVVSISDGAVDITGAAELYLHERAREIAPIQVSGAYGGAVLRKAQLLQLNSLNGELFDHGFHTMVNEVRARYDELSSKSLTFNVSKGIPWAGFSKLSTERSQMMVRTPLIDNDLVELIYRATNEVTEGEETSLRLVRDGNPLLAEKPASCLKKIAGSALRTLSKHRHGHRPLYPGLWYSNGLSGYVREILLDKRSLDRPYINKSSLENIVRIHTQGKGNYTNEITAALSAELVHRLFIDKPYV
jgi:asparagine synthase (glutamine-hydrolysing)